MKFVKKHDNLTNKVNLIDKTFVISGGTRGIGLSIAKKLASVGANVTLLGKTKNPHKKLEGTIDTAVEDIVKIHNDKNKVLGMVCDIRNESDIDNSIDQTLSKFKKIDGVILNASALCLSPTLHATEKEVNLMTDVNIKGTFNVGKKCLKWIKKSKHPHVLTISPPLDMINHEYWWTNHLYYSMSKYNMSIMAKMWHYEFPNVAVNTLWPRTTINTAPVRNILGGDDMINISRDVSIMGDAAYHILSTKPPSCSGNNFIDDEVILSCGGDVEKYKVNNNIHEKDLMPDFFC